MYTDSTWGKVLQDPLLHVPNARAPKLFKRRFRLPVPLFTHVIHQCVEKNICQKKPTNCFGLPSVPFDLKVLGVLRIAGRGWCLDDVLEASGISTATMQSFFHEFTRDFVAAFYEMYVYRPVGEELKKVMAVYSKMGMDGAASSTDCTHVVLGKCPVELTNSCTGKIKKPSLSYEASVDHRRFCQSISNGFYGTVNDKTIIKHDKYLTDLRDGLAWQNVTFTLFNADGTESTLTGPYHITDNGYHYWRCLMSPFGATSNLEQRYWSEWMESVRKDVECFNGIVKGRFRSLLGIIQFHKMSDIDNLVKFCVILHNMLILYNGHDYELEDEAYWLALNPQISADDLNYDENADQIAPETEAQQPFLEGGDDNEIQDDEAATAHHAAAPAIEVVREVQCGHHDLRDKLVINFKYKYDNGLLSWPKAFTEQEKTSHTATLGAIHQRMHK